METKRRFWVGTNGFSYAHWRERFYPRELPSSRWLAFYASRFATVEPNVTFYRLPEADVFQLWRDSTPPGFRFAVKASRLITHFKRLRGIAGYTHSGRRTSPLGLS